MSADGLLPPALMKFSSLVYEQPDLNVLSDHFRRARLRVRLSMSPSAAAAAILDLQQPVQVFHSMATLARIRHDCDLSDPVYREAVRFFDHAEARVAQWTQSTYAALLDSRFRHDLEDLLGQSLLRKAVQLNKSVQDRTIADLSEENRLVTVYQQRISDIRIRFKAQNLNLSQLEPMLQGPDRNDRRAAHQAMNTVFAENKAWLDNCFSQLIAVRNRMSRKLGFTGFTELGYIRMERVDYARADVEKFRRFIQLYFVPICQEIRRLQKRRLELDHLMYYDLPCLFPQGNPPLICRPDQLVELTGKVMVSLLGDDGSFFAGLAEKDYVDALARPDKLGGGYCSTLLTQRVPFILTNASQTARDVTVLLHETGHALASLSGFPQMKIMEDHSPSLDLCEIHSTALEYLSYPCMPAYFAENAEDYTLMHMTESLLFLPYACAVDEFQHLVYDQPDMSADERHRVWHLLEQKYQPDLDYGEDGYFAEGGAWQKKEHIYASPFYYIDYALAQIAALDLWQISRKDAPLAMKKYRLLCDLGGRDTFLQQLSEAGLSSPFEEGTIKKIAYAVCDFLDL